MQSNWKKVVQDFADSLPDEGFYSVKYLCGGLLDEKEYISAAYWKDRSTKHVLEWLQDCIHESERRLNFEKKWSVIPSMENTAAYTEQEIEKLQELIDFLSSE